MEHIKREKMIEIFLTLLELKIEINKSTFLAYPFFCLIH
jgi:hypothetical protein